MIIGLCGFQGAGKDTVADILVSKHQFIKISFGAALKDTLAILFTWDRNLLEGSTPESRLWRENTDEFWSDKLSISNFTPRKALQMIGTDLFRKNFNSNIWVDIVENKIIQLVKSNPNINIVLSDCRFLNEINMVKKFTNGLIIHVVRELPEWFEEHRSGGDVDISSIHPSEIEWMKYPFDHIITNTGLVNNLEIKIIKLVNQVH